MTELNEINTSLADKFKDTLELEENVVTISKLCLYFQKALNIELDDEDEQAEHLAKIEKLREFHKDKSKVCESKRSDLDQSSRLREVRRDTLPTLTPGIGIKVFNAADLKNSIGTLDENSAKYIKSVSYTHLTLPTICSV